MDTLLEAYSLSRLNQEKIGTLNRLITNEDIETVIQKLPINKSQGPNGFTGDFYKTFKDLIHILKLFQKIEGRENVQRHFTKPALL